MSVQVFASQKVPIDIARDWVLWEYGPSFDVRSIAPKKSSIGEIFSVDAELTETIRDNKANENFAFRTKILDAATIEFNKEQHKILGPRYSDLSKNIRVKIQTIQRSLEKDVLKAENKNFGNLILAKQMFTPIRRLLVQIKRNKSAEYDQFRDYEKYLNLLTLSGYIGREHDSIVPTSKFVQLFKKTKNSSDFEAYLLGYLLAEYFDYIIDEINVRQIVPYARLTASYYRPIKAAGKLLWLSSSDLSNSYSTTYGKIRSEYFDSYLDELTDNRILNREDDRIFGNEGTYKFISDRDYFQASSYV
jgi:hypothetical protein